MKKRKTAEGKSLWFIKTVDAIAELELEIDKLSFRNQTLGLGEIGLKVNDDKIKRCLGKLKALQFQLDNRLKDPENKTLYLKLKLSGHV